MNRYTSFYSVIVTLCLFFSTQVSLAGANNFGPISENVCDRHPSVVKLLENQLGKSCDSLRYADLQKITHLEVEYSEKEPKKDDLLHLNSLKSLKISCKKGISYPHENVSYFKKFSEDYLSIDYPSLQTFSSFGCMSVPDVANNILTKTPNLVELSIDNSALDPNDFIRTRRYPRRSLSYPDEAHISLSSKNPELKKISIHALGYLSLLDVSDLKQLEDFRLVVNNPQTLRQKAHIINDRFHIPSFINLNNLKTIEIRVVNEINDEAYEQRWIDDAYARLSPSFEGLTKLTRFIFDVRINDGIKVTKDIKINFENLYSSPKLNHFEIISSDILVPQLGQSFFAKFNELKTLKLNRFLRGLKTGQISGLKNLEVLEIEFSTDGELKPELEPKSIDSLANLKTLTMSLHSNARSFSLFKYSLDLAPDFVHNTPNIQILELSKFPISSNYINNLALGSLRELHLRVVRSIYTGMRAKELLFPSTLSSLSKLVFHGSWISSSTTTTSLLYLTGSSLKQLRSLKTLDLTNLGSNQTIFFNDKTGYYERLNISRSHFGIDENIEILSSDYLTFVD